MVATPTARSRSGAFHRSASIRTQICSTVLGDRVLLVVDVVRVQRLGDELAGLGFHLRRHERRQVHRWPPVDPQAQVDGLVRVAGGHARLGERVARHAGRHVAAADHVVCSYQLGRHRRLRGSGRSGALHDTQRATGSTRRRRPIGVKLIAGHAATSRHTPRRPAARAENWGDTRRGGAGQYGRERPDEDGGHARRGHRDRGGIGRWAARDSGGGARERRWGWHCWWPQRGATSPSGRRPASSTRRSARATASPHGPARPPATTGRRWRPASPTGSWWSPPRSTTRRRSSATCPTAASTPPSVTVAWPRSRAATT